MSAPNSELPLTIEPEHELRFVGPFDRSVVTIMTLRNNSAEPRVFKIKTTAPKRYCVRPNIGKILPFRSTQVEICLQPFLYDQQKKNNHNFMVQSVLAPMDADLTDLNNWWKELSLEPQQLTEAKLKCVFELPGPEANAENISGISVAGGSGSAGGGGGTAGTNVSSAISETQETSNSPAATEHVSSGEIKALKEANIELRKENRHLKDQIIGYRNSAVFKTPNEICAPVLAEKQIPVFYMAIAIAAALLGLLLGKFWL